MRKLVLILLILSISIFSFDVLSYARPIDNLSSETLAISLIIDTSGSMTQTDPQRLRQSVADVFIDYLNPEDYLGIITFNSEVDLVIPIEKLSDDSRRSDLKESLSTRLDGTAHTDYKAALDEANSQLDALSDSDVSKMIIFLTDGEPDPNPSRIVAGSREMDSYMEGLWESVSAIGDKEIPVLSIGFSDGIDVDVLSRIASETGGDVRIYEDAAALDENLVQLLNSREVLVEELLELPTLSLASDFWFRKEGYRNGEQVAISASIIRGNTGGQIIRGLTVDSFQLLMEFADGNVETINLYDDGSREHSDIRANDGLFSNNISFTRNGNVNGKLSMSGRIYNEEITLNMELGDFFVADSGNIKLSQLSDMLRTKKGSNVRIPIKIENDSKFGEAVLFSIDESIGTIRNSQINLNPSSHENYELSIDLNPQLEEKFHKLTLEIESLEEATSIDQEQMEIKIEIVSTLDNIIYSIRENAIIIIPLVSIFVVLPLLILILGRLFYSLLLKAQLRISGTLTYWKETDPEKRSDLDLSSLKKNRIVISYDANSSGDFILDNDLYNYDLVIYKSLLKKDKKFVLGWKALLSKSRMTNLYVETSLPGIIEFDGEIVTKVNISNESKFSSGDYSFIYIKPETSKLKKSDEGKNILEGRV